MFFSLSPRLTPYPAQQEKFSKSLKAGVLNDSTTLSRTLTPASSSLIPWIGRASLALMVLFLFCANLQAQITTGTIFGSVKDTSGAVIPSASVELVNPEIHFDRSLTANASGEFVAADIPTGTYSVTATASGFSKFTKSGVVVDVGSRIRLGALTLKVGANTESITVQATGGEMQLQSESGERSALVDKAQIDSLLMYGGNILDYLKILPGVNSTFNGSENDKGGLDSMNFNGTRGNAHTLNVDGIANEDNGANNASQVTINTEAIRTAKVLTSNFQAEYGKASGGQIALEIQNGTAAFHGGLNYHFRHEWLDANSWFNDQTNALNKENGSTTAALTTPKLRLNNLGGQVGGPLLLPGVKNSGLRDKLFFFFSYEMIQQKIPGGTSYITVPTEAEISGDFSASKDGNGNAITITDPTTKAAFSGNKLPSGRILGSMQDILEKVYPKPNATDPSGFNRYNYQYETSYTHPRNEEIARIDYQINNKHRLFGHYVANQDSQGCPTGCDGVDGISNFEFPGGMHMDEPGYNAAVDLTSTINNTTVNEITAGWGVNKLNVSAHDNNIYKSKWNIDVPLLYATGSDSPIPDFSFGGINNQSLPWTYLGSMPFNNALTLININDNLTKTLGRHTLKMGLFIERSRKDQSAWGNANGDFSFDGQNKTQTLQSGNPFANALLGYYTNFSQSSSRLRGFYRYTQLDWYLQDTWKVNNRLTLDYGMRFPWFQPQYDARYQMAVFNPAAYVSTDAPRIYWADGSGNAFDPSNPETKLNGALAGTLVPNTGNTANGIELAKNGYYKGGVKDNGMLFEPRVGFAFDLTGNGKTIVRGGFGISHDRFQGNPVYNGVVSNPPNVYTPSLQYGTIQGLSSLGSNSGILAPGGIMGFEPSGKIPTVYSYSLGVQRDLGKGFMVDVAYVGNRQTHLSQKENLNYSPYEQTFQSTSQNPYSYGLSYGQAVPTSCDSGWEPSQYKSAGFNCMGTNALQQKYLNKYQGYGTIDYYLWNGIGNYNSLQVSLNRRFGKLFTFGSTYTWSKTMDMTDSDGSWINTISTRKYNYHLAGFDRAGNLAANYIFNMPKISRHFGGSRIASILLDDYQVSGLSLFISGSPASLGLGTWYSTYMIAGSWSEPTSIYLKQGAKPVNSRRGRYAAYNADAFQMPNIGTPTPWPQQYLRTGGTNDTDLGIHKQVNLSGNRSIELRIDAYNAFNHPQFYGRNTTVSPDTKDDATGSNANNFWGWAWNYANVVPVAPVNVRPDGNKKNLGSYFGDYSGAGNERHVELSAKFHF